jgi:hypothetical protein
MLEGRQLGAALLVAGAGLAMWSIGDREVNETHTVDETISELRLETGSSDITVKVGDGTETKVREQRSFWMLKRGDVYKVDGDKLTLTDDCGWNCDVDFEVTVPKGTKITGETKSGDLALEGVGDVDFEAVSSDVTARDIDGRVKIRLVSGDVDVDGASGAVDVEARSGDISVNRLSGSVRTKTTSGDMRVELDEPNSVEVDGTSGDITLTVPTGSYQVKAHTTSGDENVDIPNTVDGVHVIDLRTTSGDIDANVG